MNPNLLTTRGFLFFGGALLIILGLAGMVFLGPTAETSLLGNWFYLAPAENYAHLILGVISLVAYFLVSSAANQKYLVATIGVIALLAALSSVGYSEMGILTNPNFAVLQNPADMALHILIAIWALAAAFKDSWSRLRK